MSKSEKPGRSFGAGRGLRRMLGMPPPNQTFDLANENYCTMQDPDAVPIDDQFREAQQMLLQNPELLVTENFGGDTQTAVSLPIVEKAAIVLWQVGGPCTVLPDDSGPAPDPYGGYEKGYNWGYRDTNGVEHQYPEEFANSRGDAYGAAVVHDQAKVDAFATSFTKTINNSYFDSYLIEGMNGGDVDVFHGGQYTTPKTGLRCGTGSLGKDFPKTCNVYNYGGTPGLNRWVQETNEADATLVKYNRIFNIISGCWWAGS